MNVSVHGVDHQGVSRLCIIRGYANNLASVKVHCLRPLTYNVFRPNVSDRGVIYNLTGQYAVIVVSVLIIYLLHMKGGGINSIRADRTSRDVRAVYRGAAGGREVCEGHKPGHLNCL